MMKLENLQIKFVSNLKGPATIQPVNKKIHIKTYIACDGMLIDRMTVLSAGHCFPFPFTNVIEKLNITVEYENITASMLRVYTGLHDITGVMAQTNTRQPFFFNDTTGFSAQYEVDSFHVVSYIHFFNMYSYADTLLYKMLINKKASEL
jgi:hypothetical protein